MTALPPAPLPLPFEGADWRLSMGLQAISPDDIILPCDRLPAELAERARLLETRRDDVLRVLPAGEAAAAELSDRLADLLPRRFPEVWRRDGAEMEVRPAGRRETLDPTLRTPLERAARLVQEDLLLLEDGPDGPVLVAAALCFPTRWSLAEKIGRPLARIHDPVPGYGARLSGPVDRFIAKLAEGRAVTRANWGLCDDPALFQPTGHGRTARDPSIDASNAGEKVFLRVERQTLSRLPVTGAVLFTIRILQRPMADALDPESAARLADTLRAVPDDMARYKSMPVFGDAVLAWLDRRAAGD